MFFNKFCILAFCVCAGSAHTIKKREFPSEESDLDYVSARKNFKIIRRQSAVEPNAPHASCKMKCGVGTCVSSKSTEYCVCPSTHVFNGTTCIDLCAANSILNRLCPNEQCLSDPKYGFKCKCDGIYTYDTNGITCITNLGTSIPPPISEKTSAVPGSTGSGIGTTQESSTKSPALQETSDHTSWRTACIIIGLLLGMCLIGLGFGVSKLRSRRYRSL